MAERRRAAGDRGGAADGDDGRAGRRWPAIVLRVVGALLLLTAIALAISRAPDRPVASLVARWAMPPSDFVEVRGQVVHFRDQGPRDDPLPVVLLHGTGSSLHAWSGWVAAIAPQRRVITLDLPGAGLTGPLPEPAAAPGGDPAHARYRGDALARFVVEFLDTLGVSRAIVGGNSSGGEIAWRIATIAPDRVDRLILVDASGPAFEARSVPAGVVLAGLPGADRLFEAILPRALVAASVADTWGDPTAVTPELVDRHFELLLRSGNRRALVERLRAQRDDDVAEREQGVNTRRIAAIPHATLILWGGRDRLIPPAVGRTFADLVAGSRLVVFDDLGHAPHEEDPAATVAPVLDFIGVAR